MVIETSPSFFLLIETGMFPNCEASSLGLSPHAWVVVVGTEGRGAKAAVQAPVKGGSDRVPHQRVAGWEAAVF